MEEQDMEFQNKDNIGINENGVLKELIIEPGENKGSVAAIGGREQRNILSRLGFGLAAMAIAVIGSQYLIVLIVKQFAQGLADTDWYVWALTAISVVGIGLPTFYLFTRSIPELPKGEVVKLKTSKFLAIFMITAAVMYITNFFSVFLTVLISLIKGDDIFSLNPLMDVISNSNMIYTMLYAAIIAPIVEEVVFRKLLLNKLRRFGDVPAILLTAIAFGLFHMNLSQFFYATAIGLIFAYVTIKTNTIKYSIILHIMINMIGTVVAPIATTGNIVGSLLVVLWVFLALGGGITLFILNVKKIKLGKAAEPVARKSVFILNAGTIVYVAICFAMIVSATLA
ncbi:MAG: type II CAAX endopeptidase family protein [Mobilitalea sp.]